MSNRERRKRSEVKKNVKDYVPSNRKQEKETKNAHIAYKRGYTKQKSQVKARRDGRKKEKHSELATI